jgi:uncharacterized alkaline shock family protein YloU
LAGPAVVALAVEVTYGDIFDYVAQAVQADVRRELARVVGLEIRRRQHLRRRRPRRD